jgi:hypothetical protein
MGAMISPIFIFVAVLYYSIGEFIMTLLPLGIILFEIFSILGIIAFFVISSFVIKYVPKVVNNFKPEKVELSIKIVEIILWIIIIFIAIGAYTILFGVMAYLGKAAFMISIIYLVLIILQIINILIFKILKIGYKKYLKVFLAIEPYIMLFILTIIKK